MINIAECIEKMHLQMMEQGLTLKSIDHYFQICDYLKLLEEGERYLRRVLKMFLLSRELICSLYEMLPSLPQTVDVHKAVCNVLNISVGTVDTFPYPVFRITLPYLLPNKRRRKTERNDAIPGTVQTAVRQYCNENGIEPFQHATVFFVSYYGSGGSSIDNDNKESATIMNGLCGLLIRDDRPSFIDTCYVAKQTDQDAKTEIYVVNREHGGEVYSTLESQTM